MNYNGPECPTQIFGVLSLLGRNPDKRNIPVRDLWIAFSWNYDGDIPEFDKALRWLSWAQYITLSFTELGEILTVGGLTRLGAQAAAEAIQDEIDSY